MSRDLSAIMKAVKSVVSEGIAKDLIHFEAGLSPSETVRDICVEVFSQFVYHGI